ncbi:FecR family protein [Sphingobacterium siyangense]|uniref:FecR family protein n=1 Tax=Sphingobacterium siyangense TaxID=459529 RepID=UPI003DA606AC
MDQEVKQLFDKYVSGAASIEETRQLYDYFETTGNSEELDGLIEHYLQSEEKGNAETVEQQVDGVTAGAWTHIKANLPEIPEAKRKMLPLKWIAAAAALLVIGMTITFMNMDHTPDAPQLTSIYGSDVLPGSNKATLTLSNGKRYALKNNKEGLQVQGDAISYQDGEAIASTDAVTQATISVPNGGVYTLKLADGTRVQLNSGSVLTYPIQFKGTERLVKLSGEGYFEVSHDATKPFKVQSRGQVVTVLGTHFNVQAYDNEPIETALLEGKVLVQATSGSGSAILSPNQLTRFTNGKFQLKNVNAQDYIGWTKNLFVFNNLSLGQIFKHLERWYDVEIDYPANITDEQFMMEIPKNRKLSEILEAISVLDKLNFKIQGRRITVAKQ